MLRNNLTSIKTIFVSPIEKTLFLPLQTKQKQILISMKAYVFPGQGAQFTGMGKDLYEKSAEAILIKLA